MDGSVGAAFPVGDREDLYRRIVETATDGVWVLDDRDRTVFVNRRMAEMLGYEPEDLLGRSPRDFVAADDAALVGAALGRPHDGVSERYDVRLRHRDGPIVSAFVSSNALEGPDGGYAGSLAMVSDVTARVEAERERAELESRFQQSQKLEGIGRLAGGVAHDFNNLLAVILNYADFLGEALEDRPDLRADVGEIREAAERAASLTRQLLLFSRREVVQPQVLDLNAIVAEMERLLRRTIGEDVELRVQLAPRAGAVRADRGQLEQVLLNLAVNARDAMPDGGALQIDTAPVVGDAGREEVLMTVRDTGCGMDPEVASRAFEPFFTTKPAGEGSGLGLATVYGIVAEAGGWIDLDTRPGAGASFAIRLPRVAAAPPAAPEDAGAAEETARGETVLLVEDEDAVRRVTSRILSAHGYEVLEASGAGAALDLAAARASEVDLLLTDLVMPAMSGEALAVRLRERDPGLAVLYMSGYTDDGLIRRGIRDREVSFLAKPFSAGELLKRVREALAGADTPIEAPA